MHFNKKIKFLLMVSILTVSVFASDTVKIGVQAPITGKYANEGQGIEQFVKLIVNEKNKNGGLLGKKIEVVVCDDEAKAQKAAICAKKLASAKVFAVIGSYSSGPTQAAQTTYFRKKIIQTSDATASALVNKRFWTFFRNSFPNSAQSNFTANYLVNVKKFKRIVILSDYSSYSDGLANSTYEAVKKINGNIIYRGKVKSGMQNFTAILTKIKAMHPDVIYYSGYYTDGGLIRSQQVQLGINATFVGGDSNDNPDFLKLAGNSAEGTILINVPTPSNLPYDEAKKYLKLYEDTYKMLPPSIWSVANADGLRVIFHAVEETKSFKAKDISNFLHNLKGFKGITGPITFNKIGERVGAQFMVYEIQKDGSYKTLK